MKRSHTSKFTPVSCIPKVILRKEDVSFFPLGEDQRTSSVLYKSVDSWYRRTRSFKTGLRFVSEYNGRIYTVRGTIHPYVRCCKVLTIIREKKESGYSFGSDPFHYGGRESISPTMLDLDTKLRF